VQEFSIVPVAFYKGLEVSAIGEVAATLARQGQFDPHPAHFFEEEDSGPQFSGPPSSHQARGAPTHYDHVPFHFLQAVSDQPSSKIKKCQLNTHS
jgi:hypothetical protein